MTEGENAMSPHVDKPETGPQVRDPYAGLEQVNRRLEEEIAERRKTEEALRHEERRWKQIVDFLPDATFVIDTEGKVVAWNRAIEKMTGIRAGDMLGRGNHEYALPFYGERRPVLIDLVTQWDKTTAAAYRYVKKEGDALISETYDCLVAPGRTLRNKASVLYDENGQVTGAIESIRDITKRRQFESSLRESEGKYRGLFEQARDAIVITTDQGDVVDANSFALNLFGCNKEEILGLNFQQLYVDREDGRRFAKGMKEKGSLDEFFTRLRRFDGAVMECTMNVTAHRDSNGATLEYQGIIRDVTEARRLQMQLHESRKMEAIATLAGGIAHQFNNALTPILGNIDLLKMDHPDDADMMDILKQMKESARRMAHLTRQLLAYAREGKYRAERIALTDLVLGTVPLLEHTLNPDVRLETELPTELPYVEVDVSQMQMVLSGLVANSNEAMGGPGRIRISAANAPLDRNFLAHHGLEPVPYVCLSVKDTGNGMDEETRNRIFDPFFTTHFLGRGLGMAAVYGIIKNHRGAIEVDSEVGKGTLVRIYLPAMTAASRGQGSTDAEPPPMEARSVRGTVLVIEDEEMVMEMTQAILERLGFRILKARTGKEAVETAKIFEGEIDLALLDIKLPDMMGLQVYASMAEARPGLKVLVCSGYALDGYAQEILDAGAQGFVQKPFSIENMAARVKDVLGR